MVLSFFVVAKNSNYPGHNWLTNREVLIRFWWEFHQERSVRPSVALFQTGINTSTVVRGVCVGVYTNNADDAHILTVPSYHIFWKHNEWHWDVFEKCLWMRKGLKMKHCFSHAVILFDVIWLQLREHLLERHPVSTPLRLIEHMLCSAGPPQCTTTGPPCGITSRRLVQS